MSSYCHNVFIINLVDINSVARWCIAFRNGALDLLFARIASFTNFPPLVTCCSSAAFSFSMVFFLPVSMCIFYPCASLLLVTTFKFAVWSNGEWLQLGRWQERWKGKVRQSTEEGSISFDASACFAVKLAVTVNETLAVVYLAGRGLHFGRKFLALVAYFCS